MRKAYTAIVVAIACTLLIAIAILINPLKPRGNLRDAREYLRTNKFEKAEQLAIEISKNDPSKKREALLLAIKAATARSRFDLAWEHAEEILASSASPLPEDGYTAGELAFRSGQLQIAIKHFERLVSQYSDRIEFRQRMIYLYGLTGRNFEAIPHLRWLLDHNSFDVNTLLVFGAQDQVVNFSEALNSLQKQNPKDPELLLALGRVALANLKNEEAIGYLKAALQSNPDSAEAISSFGHVSLELNNDNHLRDWWQLAAGKQIEHPVFWITLGKWANQYGDHDNALACFREAARIDANNGVVFFLLAEEYKRRQDRSSSEAALERHKKLSELTRLCLSLYGRPPKAPQMLQAANLCLLLGRTKEAYAWFGLVKQGIGNPTQDERKQAGVSQSQLREEALVWCDDVFRNLASIAELKLDMPRFSTYLKSNGADQTLETSREVMLADVAKQVGFEFNYFTSPKPGSTSRQLYEFAGGGVGIIDFDRDGWPDAMLPQGCTWPPPDKPVKILASSNSVDDQQKGTGKIYTQFLCRNMEGKRWRDVSAAAGIQIVSYGQGVACGDVNSDGFDDVYVACIGQNLLLLNNGDGTFDEAADSLGIIDKSWTTSCAIADVNLDGLADIYDVNYLQGDDLFSRECIWEGNRIRICGPGSFEACSDRLWINTGIGFEERSKEMGTVAKDGKGLGIVIGSLLQPNSNCIFIANDQTDNHFFSRAPIDGTAGSESLGPTGLLSRFANIADLLGVAVDGNGAKQGCMGIAVGDFDKNGYEDLFVTNYVTEPNTLYSQFAGHRFEDLTRRSMLREPSIAMVGFGTQAIDPLLTGDLDLVVTNGHLDDFAFKGQAYEMPPQYFRNNGNGRFTEIAAGWEGYWEGKYLGRAMAKLDWNRDGREDLIVTHLDAPSALIEGQSINAGNFLAVKLSGTTSSRDSIGTRITVFDGKRERTQILIAGNGYQCSNEKEIIFGIGKADEVEWLEISWIGGQVQRFDSIKSGRWLAIENLGLFEID